MYLYFYYEAIDKCIIVPNFHSCNENSLEFKKKCHFKSSVKKVVHANIINA